MHFEIRYTILNHIEKSNEASIHELSNLCNVTLPTMRKYLKSLHDDEMILFSRGVAKKLNKYNESLLGWRLDENSADKKTIGKKIGDIVQDGETIFLGGGSTVFYCLNHLVNKKNITVVTNSLHVMNFLVNHSNIHVICTGGSWNHRARSFVGFSKSFENFYPDRSFIGALAIDINKGITQHKEIFNTDEFIIFQQAREQYIIADKSKFERFYSWTVLPISSICNIITDTIPKNNKDWVNKGINII